jgi:NADPH:quinone reductase-like Zn-dependent oxidoreductase
MRAVRLYEFGGADKLVYEESAPEPAVDSGEVKVRVRACALNHLDIWVRNGIPAYKTPLPHILGSDIAGEVVEVGSGVRGWGKGDEVILYPDRLVRQVPILQDGAREPVRGGAGDWRASRGRLR